MSLRARATALPQALARRGLAGPLIGGGRGAAPSSGMHIALKKKLTFCSPRPMCL
jgi:hypothetical protein